MIKLKNIGKLARKATIYLGLLNLMLGITLNASANAPGTNSRFTLLSSDDGLATGSVKAIYQDSVGYMWFGGQDGLARYDGYEFELFTHSASDPDSISHNDVSSIIEDNQNRLWIATDSGMNLFDRETNRFQHYPMPNTEDVLVRHIEPDKDGMLWLGTPNGLVKFNPDSKQFSLIGLRDPITQQSIETSILHLSIDNQGNIWVSTDGAGLFHYDPVADTFQRYLHDPTNPASIAHNVVWMAKQFHDHKIWIATDVDLSVLDPTTGEFQHYRYVKDDPTTIAGPTVTSLLKDSDGFLWTGTNLGLSVFDFATKKFTRIVHDPNDRSSISSNIIRTIYQDKNEDVWIGTFPDGVNFFNRGDMPFQTFRYRPEDTVGINANAVLSFLEDSKGRFWVGTDGGGANLFDPQQEKPVYYEPDESRVYEPSLISGNAILDLAEAPNGDIWMGHWGRGISRLTPETGAIQHYKLDHNTPNMLRSGNVWVLFFDKDETLWVGTIGGGLYRYNAAEDNFVIYPHNPDDQNTSGSMIIWTIMQDSKGLLWIGTDDGLDRYDPTTQTFQHYRHDGKNTNSLGHNVVLTIHEASDGTMWVGTRGGGLNKLDQSTDTFTRFDRENGFPSNVINSIEEDRSGNLWLGSNKGLIRFNPTNKNVRTYNKSNGIQGDHFNINTSITLNNGNLVFGGTKGYTVFNPDDIADNDYLPPVVFRELKILNETASIGTEKSPLQKSINQSDNLKLNYNQYVVTFKFAGLSYRNPEKNQYAYQLEPFDKKWNYVGTQRTATYTNLDAGSYRLKVKAANNEGLWNESAKTITIKVLPPPWLTWWAFTLYGLVIFVFIAGAIEYQRRKRQFAEKLNVILEEKVSQRTAQLRIKNYDIQIMLNNIRQGLITIQGDGKIDAEYSRFIESIFETENIAHQAYDRLLFSNSNLSQNDIAQVTEAVKAIVNEDIMNFDFNQHLLCSTITIQIKHKRKILDLDWSAITEQGDDVVTKIMICIRDVTELRQAEFEREQQKQELTIIGQLIQVSEEKFKRFCKSAQKLLAQNRQLIASALTGHEPIKSEPIESEHTETRSAKSHPHSFHLNKETLACLFRNMHTIKGNSRTYGFDFLSDAAHKAEDVYSRLSSMQTLPENAEHTQVAQLQNDLGHIENTLQKYQSIYQRVFEREQREDKHPQTATHLTLQSTLLEITKALPSIASELGKAPPRIEFLSKDLVITEDLAELVTQSFTHILRNSIDHGIEPTAERCEKGKPEHGTISLQWHREDAMLCLQIRDDGRGLDIARLHLKGKEQGLWTDEDEPEAESIAQLIFSSGMSTKESVNQISGRGVGMDAAKAFIEAQGGAISIQLLQSPKEKYTNTPFELQIHIPLIINS